MQKFYQYIIVLGSNLKNPIANIQKTIAMLKEKCNIIKKTNIKKTIPVLYIKQPYFFNQGILIHSLLNASELLNFCKEIEKKIGRKKSPIRYGARVIDIDIVFSSQKKNM